MNSVIHKKRQEGFTIVEVLIVLAIAGLIILIVFLAVPALQRNSRNTQRKNDVGALLAAYAEKVNNSQGNIPAGCNGTTTTPTTCFVRDIKAAYYEKDTDKVVFVNNSSAITTAQSQTDLDRVTILNFAKCDTNGNAVGTNATKRSVVAIYSVETAGGSTTQCQEG